jgi:uncharacterized protein YjbJ (UPF0337 family)
MEKSSVAGATNEFKGAAKDAIGKTVGDSRFHSNGESDKPMSRIHSYAGSLNAAVRETEAMKSAGLLIISPFKRDTGA